MPAYFDSGFMYKEPAWHKLGTVVEHKVYSSEEAIKLAGLDWTVSKRPVFADYDGQIIDIDNLYAIVRDDTKAVLGNCSERYSLIQNREVFEFFDPFLHEKDVFITTAGSLKGGGVVWALAEVEGLTQHEVVDGDFVNSRILLATSHDRSLSTTVKFVHERVVCANTLAVAMSEGGAFKTIRHTGDVRQQMADIQASIDIFKQSFTEKIDIYRELVDIHWSNGKMVDYLEKLFEPELIALSKKKLEEEGTETVDIYDLRATKTIYNNFLNTPDLQTDEVKSTAYAGLNAVSEFVCHQRASNMDNRLNSVWFGSDAALLQKAERLALSM